MSVWFALCWWLLTSSRWHTATAQPDKSVLLCGGIYVGDSPVPFLCLWEGERTVVKEPTVLLRSFSSDCGVFNKEPIRGR